MKEVSNVLDVKTDLLATVVIHTSLLWHNHAVHMP